jgi:hypothetical protein
MKLSLTLVFLGSIVLFVFGEWRQIRNLDLAPFPGLTTVSDELDNLPQRPSGVEMQIEDELCSNVVGGLKYCISERTPSFKLGDKVIVNTSLRNVTDKEVRVSAFGTFESLHRTSLTDPTGLEIKSRKEILVERIANNSATDQELSEILPFGSTREELSKVLQPGEELMRIYNLSEIYHFDKIGTYHLQMSRLLAPKPSSRPNNLTADIEELLIDRIEIRIR